MRVLLYDTTSDDYLVAIYHSQPPRENKDLDNLAVVIIRRGGKLLVRFRFKYKEGKKSGYTLTCEPNMSEGKVMNQVNKVLADILRGWGGGWTDRLDVHASGKKATEIILNSGRAWLVSYPLKEPK